MKKFKNVKIFTDNIDELALEQLKTLVKTNVFEDMPIRIMPDVHTGAGCVIGFTAPIKNKIIPNLVGVDIGCGMLCIELGKIDIDFEKLDKVIRENVPSGKNVGEKTEEATEMIKSLRAHGHLKNVAWLRASLGTLGGGNHFIEIDEDESGVKYLIVHTGSRNLGKQIAEHYQSRAVKEYKRDCLDKIKKELMAKSKECLIQKRIEAFKNDPKRLPDDLCYVQGQAMEDYLFDMQICTKFADRNRQIIAEVICKKMEFPTKKSFTTRHNYISTENLIRKGAISAKQGEKLLIPLNMRDGCIIGIGKGNEDWNCSAPHGAGRIMSRAQAKKELDLNDFKAAMQGIFSTTVTKDTIDEAPFAYKPSDEIISLVKDTVDIVKIIKPIYNFKAAD